MNAMPKIRVMSVDDSAVTRRMLPDRIASAPDTKEPGMAAQINHRVFPSVARSGTTLRTAGPQPLAKAS